MTSPYTLIINYCLGSGSPDPSNIIQKIIDYLIEKFNDVLYYFEVYQYYHDFESVGKFLYKYTIFIYIRKIVSFCIQVLGRFISSKICLLKQYYFESFDLDFNNLDLITHQQYISTWKIISLIIISFLWLLFFIFIFFYINLFIFIIKTFLKYFKKVCFHYVYMFKKFYNWLLKLTNRVYKYIKDDFKNDKWF